MIIENQTIRDLTKFTHSTYIKLLNKLRDKYLIVPFNQISKSDKPYIILRHDIDASLDLALEMAIVENKINIKSTYFILFSHKLYNILEKNSLETLRKISNLGHEIGLHYDLETYDCYNKSYSDTLQSEVSLLESLLNLKIKCISMHNPSISMKEDPFKFTNEFINAYNPKLYDLYLSDSCRAWNMEDLGKLTSLCYNKVQLVIHPFLWTKNIVDRNAVLEDLFNKISSENIEYRNNWINLWNNNIKVIEYDKKVKN